MVHVFVCSAVDGSFGGELQWVKEILTLESERALQIEQGVADSTGPVVHKLDERK